MWVNFKKMPLILKFLTVHALACLFFLLSSVFPHISSILEGRTITLIEWWTSGAGLLATLFGTLLPFSGFLFLKRAAISRFFYLNSMLIAFYSPAFFMDGSKYPLGYYFSSLLIVLLIGGYLYFGKTSKAYFSPEENLETPA